MSTLPPRPTPAGLRLEARRNLRGTVITIEMTLISVLVGVNLFPLMESATPRKGTPHWHATKSSRIPAYKKETAASQD